MPRRIRTDVIIRAARARWLRSCGWKVNDGNIITAAQLVLWETVEKVVRHDRYKIGLSDAMRAVAPRVAEAGTIWRLSGQSLYDWVTAVIKEGKEDHNARAHRHGARRDQDHQSTR